MFQGETFILLRTGPVKRLSKNHVTFSRGISIESLEEVHGIKGHIEIDESSRKTLWTMFALENSRDFTISLYFCCADDELRMKSLSFHANGKILSINFVG